MFALSSSSVQSPPRLGPAWLGQPMRSGRPSGSMIWAGQRMVARSMALRSSRILPGQGSPAGPTRRRATAPSVGGRRCGGRTTGSGDTAAGCLPGARQRRNLHFDDVEAKQQIFTKLAALHRVFQVAMGGGDDADIGATRGFRRCARIFFLQKARFGLQGGAISLTSSRNGVPPCAASTRPG